jgi:predicted nucleic acid-binding protein
MYLVDTNILSAGGPSKAAPPSDLLAWMDQASPGLFLSVVTAAEVTAGISKALRAGANRKAKELNEWWDTVEHLYGARILPIDIHVAHAAGRLTDLARAMGYAPGFADVAIAATAEVYGLVILTRNLKHFQPLGVSVVDPFERLPTLPD